MRPPHSPTKKIDEYCNYNYKNDTFVFRPYVVVIAAIFTTLNFGYILKYLNFN